VEAATDPCPSDAAPWTALFYPRLQSPGKGR
jgi:hypothetical protein